MLSKDDTVCTYGLSKACNFCMWSVLHDKLQTKGIKVKPLLAHPCFADNLCQKVITQTHCTSGPSGPQLSAEYVWADGMGMLITGAMGCGCMEGGGPGQLSGERESVVYWYSI